MKQEKRKTEAGRTPPMPDPPEPEENEGRVETMEPRTVEVDIIRGNGPTRALRKLARGAVKTGRDGRYRGQPYLLAEVVAVHIHGCNACTLGKRMGPCNCGAQELFDQWEAYHARQP